VPIVLEALQRPLIGVLGPDVSSWLERLAATRMSNCAATSTFATLNTARGIRGSFRGRGTLHADAVIVGGRVGELRMAGGIGLTLDNGVVVDENLLARESIAAIGDVARFSWPM